MENCGRRGRNNSDSKALAFALLSLLILSGYVNTAAALSVTVADVECVSEYVFFEGDLVSGNFVAVDHEVFWSSDHPGIDFTVTSPGGSVVHSIKGSSGDKFQFKAPQSGMYKFCFHNQHSTPETVSFHIHVGHIPKEQDLAKGEHLNPIDVKIAELRELLESVKNEQAYLKYRDAWHRHTNENTSKLVIYFTVAEYLLLLVASGLQVGYIRRLFSKAVGYNRI